MRLAAFSVLVLAACSSGASTEAGPDGGDQPGQPDAAGDEGGDPDGCGPANCDGCCDGGSCREGNSADECGAGGAACQACGRWGECSEAAICELADATRWDVVMESASVSEINQGGTNWDGGTDLPDVYVRASVVDPGSDAIINVRTDDHETLTPTWNQTLLANLAGGALEGIQIELFDDDDNDDDSMGRCIAAIRLEDAEAGVLELDCPRGLGTGRSRAGWTLRMRLEPRSSGRPDAPALDRRAAAPLENEPGTCIIRWDRGQWLETSTFDSWGRPMRHELRNDDGTVELEAWECSGADYCEQSSVVSSFRRLEAGPFGRRVRVAYNEVHLYDSIGRRVARHHFSDAGGLFDRTIFLYAAKTKVQHFQDLGESPSDVVRETTEFDENGSPIFIDATTYMQEVELNDNGLPVHIEVVKSTNPDMPVGIASDYVYEGAGCAEVVAAEMTNGLVDR